MESWNGTDGNTAKGNTGKEQYFWKDSCIYIAGKFQCRKTSWMYKMMMNIMVKTAGKALEKKTDRTPEEEDMHDMMLHGGERVRIQNLQGVISWYNSKR